MKVVLLICAASVLCCMLFPSCNDKLNVNQQVDYSLECWHLPNTIGLDEEVELRLTLKRSADFEETDYYIGYIQLAGQGVLYDREETILENRELYELTSIAELDRRDPCKQQFTLFYKNTSNKSAEIQIVVVDSFGQERTLNVQFNVGDEIEGLDMH